MNKNPKAKKPQAKVTKGKAKATSEHKATKKVSAFNENQRKKNSATKVEEPKVAKRRTWAVEAEEPKL